MKWPELYEIAESVAKKNITGVSYLRIPLTAFDDARDDRRKSLNNDFTEAAIETAYGRVVLLIC